MAGVALILSIIVCTTLAASLDNTNNNGGSRNSVFETPENIMAAGYHAEVHNVTTHDGYILEMHRIPYRRHEHEGDADRPVVFLMHGLLAASNSFIFLEPEYSIAFNLADAGFDVWMGNARGTKNSRFHVTLDPDSGRQDRLEFFDFSWEEIGMYDVASMVDYALELSGKDKLHYIGHSQGGTVFLVLASMRPEYNEKFASVHLLAGVGYMDYFPNFFLRNLARFTNTIWRLGRIIGIVEIFPPINRTPSPDDVTADNNVPIGIVEASETKLTLADYCTGNPTMKDFCELIGIRELLYDDNDDSDSILDDLEDLLNLSGGAALKQIAHYGQNIQDTSFRRWNYGSAQNLQVYGTEEPPIYNLTLITANVTMHYTVSDDLLDERDVYNMVRDMPNTVARRVARSDFLHADFVMAIDVRELVTEHIIKVINERDSAEPGDGGDTSTPNPGSSSSIILSFIIKLYLITFSLYAAMSS